MTLHINHVSKKKKEQSHLSASPDRDREVGESQNERESHRGESEGDQSGSMERKGWTPQ